MRASTKRIRLGVWDSSVYHGCVKDDANKVIWECDHSHRFRDTDLEDRPGHLIGVSAKTCSVHAMAQMEHGDVAKGMTPNVGRY